MNFYHFRVQLSVIEFQSKLLSRKEPKISLFSSLFYYNFFMDNRAPLFSVQCCSELRDKLKAMEGKIREAKNTSKVKIRLSHKHVLASRLTNFFWAPFPLLYILQANILTWNECNFHVLVTAFARKFTKFSLSPLGSEFSSLVCENSVTSRIVQEENFYFWQ